MKYYQLQLIHPFCPFLTLVITWSVTTFSSAASEPEDNTQALETIPFARLNFSIVVQLDEVTHVSLWRFCGRQEGGGQRTGSGYASGSEPRGRALVETTAEAVCGGGRPV